MDKPDNAAGKGRRTAVQTLHTGKFAITKCRTVRDADNDKIKRARKMKGRNKLGAARRIYQVGVELSLIILFQNRNKFIYGFGAGFTGVGRTVKNDGFGKVLSLGIYV